MATKKTLAVNNLINDVDKLEGKMKVTDDPDKLQEKINDLKRKIIEVDAAESEERIDALLNEIRGMKFE